MTVLYTVALLGVPVLWWTAKPEPPSCALVSVTNTNMKTGVDGIVSAYMQTTESHGADAERVSTRLMSEFGGFWDTYMMGSEFSYSVFCSSYVELASHKWNVLLCKESADPDAEYCGLNLHLYHNGTMQPKGADYRQVASETEYYSNHRVDKSVESQFGDMHTLEMRRILDNFTVDGLQHPNIAETIRGDVQRMWPHTKWNVLIERDAHQHYYYSEEQFNMRIPLEGMAVTVFDRRCYTLGRDRLWRGTSPPPVPQP